MPDTLPFTVLQAALWGALHALIPCAHSWPMLVPFALPGQRPLRAAVLFGSGKVANSLILGAVVGSAAGTVAPDWLLPAEEITGGVLIALGVLLAIRPSAGHLGHMHGPCDPARGPGCEHAGHQPRRFQRLGPSFGLVVLGMVNMAIPCWTNLGALGLAGSTRSLAAGLAVFGTYGMTSAVVMAVILVLVRRGLHLFDRLASGRLDTILLRISGVLLVALGLSLLLHWHDHA